MSRSKIVNPEPFFLEGAADAVLLLHGFMGSPPEMRLIGEDLHSRGLTVLAPLLPGHGTNEEDMSRRRWTEWRQSCEDALARLQARGGRVVVAGLSMGSLLALSLAADHAELAGAIAYSPALILADRRGWLVPIVKHVVPYIRAGGDNDLGDPAAIELMWSYDRIPLRAAHELLKLIAHTRRALPRITVPVLIVCVTRDRAIHPDSPRYTYEHVGSRDKELVTLHNSGHGVTVDAEWREVAERTYRFVNRVLAPQAGAAQGG